MQADSLPAEPQGKPKDTRMGSLSLLQRIFPTQELNQDLLNCRQILYQLSYQESPGYMTVNTKDSCELNAVTSGDPEKRQRKEQGGDCNFFLEKSCRTIWSLKSRGCNLLAPFAISLLLSLPFFWVPRSNSIQLTAVFCINLHITRAFGKRKN